MAEYDPAQPWYHGSPLELTELRAGSTITQDRDLAREFSHKPPLVVVSDDGRIRHNGRTEGLLYRVSEAVQAGDIVPVPRSTMAPGKEWLTTRPLRVTLLERTSVRPVERLSWWEETLLTLLLKVRRRLGI